MTTKQIAGPDSHARQWVVASVAWMDSYWDEAAGLLWSPADRADPDRPQPVGTHMVRETGWYALGLLLRDHPGDRERAVRALETVLLYQFDEPGRPYHGTFYRAPEEPHPPDSPLEWKHYDPNWREFIVTTLIIILQEYEAGLPPALVAQIDRAIPKAIQGALARQVSPSYTNIALMNAFMLCYAGSRLGQPAWIEQGENMALEIHRLFERHHSFEEYNSPTYYGVDLYALALWRTYADRAPMSSPLLVKLGTDMEAALWTGIGCLYHAGLRNLCGPFDRSYGMDMRKYVALAGEWIGLITGKDPAPFPPLDRPFAHSADLCFAPCAAILGTQAPADVTPHFFAFQGERQVEQVLSDAPRRVVTAWLGPALMLGAQQSSDAKRGGPQFHPATIHWKIDAENIGWIRLIHSEPVDARASENRLDISGTDELIFQVHVPDGQPMALQPDHWSLPGLSVRVETDALEWHVELGTDWMEVRYGTSARRLVTCTLMTHAQPSAC